MFTRLKNQDQNPSQKCPIKKLLGSQLTKKQKEASWQSPKIQGIQLNHQEDRVVVAC